MMVKTVAILVATLNQKSPEDKGIAQKTGLGLSKKKYPELELTVNRHFQLLCFFRPIR